MATEVLLPQWGMGMQDAVVVAWLKAVGDAVGEGEGLVEVEAAKAIEVVPAPVAGTLTEILAEVDATVEVRGVLAIIEESA
jgi:pyruvate/2-oxoglutarate dehydrogenase complex dihydrolipoamide acyltransferase (E2) component